MSVNVMNKLARTVNNQKRKVKMKKAVFSLDMTLDGIETTLTSELGGIMLVINSPDGMSRSLQNLSRKMGSRIDLEFQRYSYNHFMSHMAVSAEKFFQMLVERNIVVKIRSITHAGSVEEIDETKKVLGAYITEHTRIFAGPVPSAIIDGRVSGKYGIRETVKVVDNTIYWIIGIVVVAISVSFILLILLDQ